MQNKLYMLKRRLKKHNLGRGAKYTRGHKWKILYFETLNSKSRAMKREYELKKNRSFRNKIKKNLI